MLKKTSLLLLSGASLLFSQDFLDPIVVTATRTVQTESTAPYTSSVLDADYISQNTRRTLPDVLQYTPGVLVQKTAYGHGSPFIRGFTGRQNLLLMDGIRINNSTYRGGPVQYWNTIDPLSLDHVELIKSQGSVLYGSDAAGGTLNAFGKSSGFRSEAADQLFVGGSASYENTGPTATAATSGGSRRKPASVGNSVSFLAFQQKTMATSSPTPSA